MNKKNAALHQLTLEELEGKLLSLRDELPLLRMKKVANKLDNVSQIYRKADEIARIETILNHRRAIQAQEEQKTTEKA